MRIFIRYVFSSVNFGKEQYHILDSTADVAMAFRYSSGEPMAYAEVLVWHPEDTRIEYQKAIIPIPPVNM